MNWTPEQYIKSIEKHYLVSKSLPTRLGMFTLIYQELHLKILLKRVTLLTNCIVHFKVMCLFERVVLISETNRGCHLKPYTRGFTYSNIKSNSFLIMIFHFIVCRNWMKWWKTDKYWDLNFVCSHFCSFRLSATIS